MAKVTIENLVKTYPEKRGPGVTAVRSINLTIEDREFMVLVGPSGCGKSTTLRMIAGLEEITGGTVTIGQKIVNDILPKDRDIAMVFQNYALYPHMSVYENMAFGLTLQKVPKIEIDHRVKEAAQLLGLESLLDRRPKALSGGQRQRVAVGRAIVRKPKVFLFDEPLSNLDAKMRGSTRTEISRLHARLAATMIYVTHDQVEAMTMGDRICVMKDGEIMQVATPLEIYNHPANLFVAGFIGSPPMNFIQGMLQSHGSGYAFVEQNNTTDRLEFQLSATQAARVGSFSGQAVTLGIRPEDIHELSGSTPHASQPIELTLDLAEPMGAETYLHLTTGLHPLIARVRPHDSYTIGRKLRFVFDYSKVHFFDPQSGKVIG